MSKELEFSPEAMLWKQLGVGEVRIPFSCGGDSMNELEVELYDKDDNRITEPVKEVSELISYFENSVYKEVEFYEVSDGHYMGESGSVIITMDDETGEFEYYKDAEEEWEETFSGTMAYQLSEKQIEVIEKVASINGGGWDDGRNINYKQDCIITDEEEQILNDMLESIHDNAESFEVDGAYGEFQDESTRWESDMEIKDNELLVEVSQRFYVFKSSQ
jgi:virulence-associated protein VagC